VSSAPIRAPKSRSSHRSSRLEVVVGSGEHGVDAVTVAPFEIIAAHPVLGLDVPNDRPTAARRRISRRIGAVTRNPLGKAALRGGAGHRT